MQHTSHINAVQHDVVNPTWLQLKLHDPALKPVEKQPSYKFKSLKIFSGVSVLFVQLINDLIQNTKL